MNSLAPVVYLYYGHDEPSLKDHLTSFCVEISDPSTVDLNTTRLDGKTVQLGDIESSAGTLPFLADVRLVLVENLTEASNRNDMLDRLAEVIAATPDWTRLIFVETGLQGYSQDSHADQKRKAARRRALKKLINIVENDPRGKVMNFDLPRNLRQWIQQRVSHYQATIEPKASQVLSERIGHDLTLADTELIKLATYTDGERPITAEDVELLTPYTAEANIFHMVDALGQRNGQVALRLLRQLLDDGDEPLRIFGMIVRQYRLLLQVREQLDSGRSIGGAAQAMGLTDFVAKKLAPQARKYRLEQLEHIYRHLLQVDLEIKTGKLEPDLALDTLVAELAGHG